LAGQLAQTLTMLDSHLNHAGAARAALLSVQVYLADMQDKKQLDTAWREWIGGDSAAWPQRAVVGAQLDGGLRAEIVAQAFR
jgi:enamine deaminase RidA (YjgF/YER057c/UK114 family)